MITKLCVFPNDPIYAYYNKGEIKDRYFNPCNVFDEVHIISFCEKDVEPSKVQIIAGKAKLVIHSVGKISIRNKNSKRKEILKIVSQINPHVIRSYNSLLQGWVAAYCSEKLKIPLFLSLHVQYDEKRKSMKKENLKKYLALKYYRKMIEPYVLNQANKITIVYKVIEPYVQEICKKTPELLYNRINLNRFHNGKRTYSKELPIVLSVGRLTARKNHDCTIKAIKDLDVYFHLIGDGEEFKNLSQLVEKLGISKKVIFTKSVPNEEIQNYYKSADIFVSMHDPQIEGLPMPVLEAMASGLPVITTKPREKFSDGLNDSVIYSKIEPNLVNNEIKRILEDKELAKSLSANALRKSKDFDGEKTEQRESEIYQELLSSKRLA